MSEWNTTLVPSPSAGGVSSLSDILEPTGSVPRAYYLSRRAATGILSRAGRRGKKLPPLLDAALREVACLGPNDPVPNTSPSKTKAAGEPEAEEAEEAEETE
jgi:hypothetical protein